MNADENKNALADADWLVRQGFTADEWGRDDGDRCDWYTSAESLELHLKRNGDGFSLHVGSHMLASKATRGQVWALLFAIRKVLNLA